VSLSGPDQFNSCCDPVHHSLHHDLAAAKPDIAARLTSALDAWNQELIDPVFPGSIVKDGDWGPGGANQTGKPNRENKKVVK
jgi:hypothetical protein